VTTFGQQLTAAFAPIGGVYDDGDIARALSWAESEVSEYCNRTFDLIEDDTEVLTPHRGKAMLSQFPVVNVSLVEALLPAPGGGLEWTEVDGYRVVNDTGILYCTGYVWPALPGSLRVTYDHGFETIPQSLINVASRFAQQFLENPALAMQRKVGDIESRFSGSFGLSVSDLDRRILDRYTSIEVG
jgi:hypothetical protein